MRQLSQDVVGRAVSRETIGQLERLEELLRTEAQNQNLVARSTLDQLWERHILDSAQLVRLAPEGASWVDIGSGAGLPGLVIAILVEARVQLLEPRRLRADFLTRAVEDLGLSQRVGVAACKAERAQGSFDVITARAVASVCKLLQISTHLSTRNSIWILPKGRGVQSELAEARRHWHCDAETVPSLTDPDSEILLLRNVKARGGR